MKLRALRGAITCDEDTKEQIDTQTQRLVRELLERNAIDHDDLVSIVFTATEDLTAEFPAAAARALGLGDVPLLCARELGVDARDAQGRARARALLHAARALRAPPRVPRRRPRAPGRPSRVTRAGIIGTGLVGGSVGLALRRNGVDVRGYDRDEERVARALEMGAIDEAVASAAAAAPTPTSWSIAVPVSTVADAVVEALDAGAAIVTDVGSVKAPVVEAVEAARPTLAARYVGGHPMAGSEQDGLDGADADLFRGATWVLTPTERTDPDAFATVRQTLGGRSVPRCSR